MLSRHVGTSVARAVLSVAFAAMFLVTWLARPTAQTPAPAAPAPATPTASAAQTPAPAVPVPGAVQGTPAHDTAKGAAVLAEARKAIGGEERIKAIQRLEVRGKAARILMGSNTVEGDFELQIELPGKYRRKESIAMASGDRDFGIELLQILNGALASQKMEERGGNQPFDDRGGNRGGRGGRGNINMIAAVLTGAPPQENLDPRAQEEALHKTLTSDLARLMFSWLLITSEEVAWIGTAQSPEGRADVLETKTPDGVPVRVLISEKSRMPLLIAWDGTFAQTNFNNRSSGGQRGGGRGGPSIQLQKGTLQVYMSDFKTVNGIRFPHLIQRGHNDETTEELIVRSLRINPTFKPDTFDQPAQNP